MFPVGTAVYGYTYTDEGRVRVEGVVVSVTDDPEEYNQDYILCQADGSIVYCDEQETYKAK
jgi:hypothetical protein